MAMSPRGKKILIGCAAGFSFCLFIFGIVFGLVIQKTIDEGLKDVSKVCGKGSSNYDSWASNNQSDSPPKYKKYYGFNVTNAVNYLTGVDADLQLDSRGVYAIRQNDTNFNVVFTNDNAQVSYQQWSQFQFDSSASASDCGVTDMFTNLSPGYLQLLTAVGSEMVVGLTLSNADVNYFGNPQCNSTNIFYSLSNSCTVGPDDLNCCCSRIPSTNQTFCGTRAKSLLGQFGVFDNGVVLQPNLASPLLITKTVHELAFGYPSALLGFFSASKASQSRDISTLMSMAAYTQLVLKVCNYSSTGISPDKNQLTDPAEQQLGLISCSPVDGVRFWAEIITLGEMTQPRCSFFSVNGTNPCACVNGGNTSVEAPCCTVAGFGCLATVPGYVSDALYVTLDQYVQQYQNDLTTANTGCGSYSSGQEFYWSVSHNVTTTPFWSQTGRDPYVSPTQSDIAGFKPENATYSSDVTGSEGLRFKGRGRTSSLFSDQVSDGNPQNDEISVFITQVPRAQTIYNVGSENYKGILVTRFAPKTYFLNQSIIVEPAGLNAYEVGVGTPYSGLQDVSFVAKFPAYVSRPYFLHNEELLHKGINVTLNGSPAVPNSEDHETYLLVEPSSGMTLSGHKRLMASFALPTGTANVITPKVPPMIIIPQYYMDETASLSDSQADTFKSLMSLSLAADCVLVVVSIVGGIGWIVGMIFFFRANSKRPSFVSNSAAFKEPLVTVPEKK